MTAQRIDALTSLRFFAAVSIALFHASMVFPILAVARHLALTQGVSVFFVLSGFVLSHSHKRIGERGEVGRFYVARIARIWPLHACTARVAIWLAHNDGNTYGPIAQLLNALLLQAWVPDESVYFAVNGVSWTLSDEAFFYAVFPLLARLRPRHLAILATSLLTVFMLSLVRHSELPWMLWSAMISPITRLNEFMLGIAAYHLYDARLRHLQLPRGLATLIEVLAAALSITTAYFGAFENIGRLPVTLWAPANVWFSNTGSGVPAAILIAVLAMQRGYVAKFLRLTPLVFLGETSFSIYMTHELVLRALEQNHASLKGISEILQISLYFAATLAISTIAYLLIERPSQQRVRKWLNRYLLSGTHA